MDTLSIYDLRGDSLHRLLSYVGTSQKLRTVQLVNHHIRSQVLHSTSWCRTTRLVLCEAHETHPTLNPCHFVLRNLMSDCFQPNHKSFTENCASVCETIDRLLHVRSIYLSTDFPLPIKFHLANALPVMRHLRLLRFNLSIKDMERSVYCHSLLNQIELNQRLQQSLQLSIRFNSQAEATYNEQWLQLRTLIEAARSGCVIRDIVLDNVVNARHELEPADAHELWTNIQGIRVIKISATTGLLRLSPPDDKCFIIELVNGMAGGLLKSFEWTDYIEQRPAPATHVHGQEIWIQSINQVFELIRMSQLSALETYGSASRSCCKAFTEDVNVFHSTHQLLCVVHNFLELMPQLRELVFWPCPMLTWPYTFTRQYFLLIIQRFMHRAMQHTKGFKATLGNVLLVTGDMIGIEHDLLVSFPCDQYTLEISGHALTLLKEDEEEHIGGWSNTLFALKLVHLATTRTLIMRCSSDVYGV